MACIGLLVGVGVLALRVMIERPCPTVDYDQLAHDLTIAAQPAGENGWDAIERAASLLDAAETRALERIDSEMARRALQQGPDRWRLWYEGLRWSPDSITRDWNDPDDQEQLRLALAGAQEASAAGVTAGLDGLGACSRCVAPRMRIGEASPSKWVRPLIDLCLWEMREAFVRQDDNTTGVCALRVIRIGMCAMAQDHLFPFLAAESSVARLCEELQAQCDHRAYDAETARIILDELASLDVNAGAHRAVEALRRAQADMIQRSYTVDGDGSGRFVPSSLRAIFAPIGGSMAYSALPETIRDWPDAVIDWGGWIVPSRAWAEREMARVAALLHRTLDTPRVERGTEFNAATYEEGLPTSARFTGWWVGSASRIIERHDVLIARIGGARLLLAIQVFRAERGMYPESLDDLTQAIMPILPRDPFAPDGRFRYRREANGFVLYSVGFDGIDQDGFRDSERGSGALESWGAGSDFVFSVSDPMVAIPDDR